MESSRDVEDYLQSMLDLSNPEHRKFVELLLKKLGHSFDSSSPVGKKSMASNQKSSGKTQQQDVNGRQEQMPSKKKTKQVNLFSKEGQMRESVTLPGQHRYSLLSQ